MSSSQPSPFDHDTLNALTLFFAVQSEDEIFLDAGFEEGAVEPAYGQMRDREKKEFEAKRAAWKLIHARAEVFKLIAYRFIMHKLDALKFWNEFSGMLFVDTTKRRWIVVDYYESDRQMRALSISARSERSRIRAEKLFGMLKFVGGFEVDYVASTWIGPDTALSPQFLSILPNASSESQPRLPSSISLFTASNYTPSLSSDDCSNICLSIVMQLGAAATDKFMGEERQAMVLKPGCEACGQLKASSVMKKCGACKGPLYCSKVCQVSLWKAHKETCRREVSLAEYSEKKNAEEEGKEGGEDDRNGGMINLDHVHGESCSHSHTHTHSKRLK